MRSWVEGDIDFSGGEGSGSKMWRKKEEKKGGIGWEEDFEREKRRARECGQYQTKKNKKTLGYYYIFLYHYLA